MTKYLILAFFSITVSGLSQKLYIKQQSSFNYNTLSFSPNMPIFDRPGYPYFSRDFSIGLGLDIKSLKIDMSFLYLSQYIEHAPGAQYQEPYYIDRTVFRYRHLGIGLNPQLLIAEGKKNSFYLGLNPRFYFKTSFDFIYIDEGEREVVSGERYPFFSERTPNQLFQFGVTFQVQRNISDRLKMAFNTGGLLNSDKLLEDYQSGTHQTINVGLEVVYVMNKAKK